MSGGEAPYLTGVAPPMRLLSLPAIAEEIAEDVARSGLADHCEASEENFVGRAVAAVELGAPLPIDGNSPLDRQLLDDLVRHDRRVADAEDHAAKCRTRRDALEDALVRAAPCWSWTRMLGTVAAYLLVAAIAGAGVGAILAPTLDSGFLANYLPDKLEGDAGLVVMAVAFLASGGFVFLISALQLMVALATGGKLSGARTAQLVLVDLAFAAAWGLQRLGAGGGYMAASVTVLEFVAMAGYSLALGALCVPLTTNTERASVYRPARANARAAAAACAKADAERAAAERARQLLLNAVAPRDLAARVSAVRKSLVAETARAAYRVATGAAIEKALANPTLDRLNADLDRQLAARADAVVQPPASKGLS